MCIRDRCMQCTLPVIVPANSCAASPAVLHFLRGPCTLRPSHCSGFSSCRNTHRDTTQITPIFNFSSERSALQTEHVPHAEHHMHNAKPSLHAYHPLHAPHDTPPPAAWHDRLPPYRGDLTPRRTSMHAPWSHYLPSYQTTPDTDESIRPLCKPPVHSALSRQSLQA